MDNYNNQFKPESQGQTAQPIPTLPSSLPEERNDKEGLKSIISTIGILLLAPILALAITAFVFQSYEVDGPSMENTLQNRDRLIVWKLGHTISKVTRKPYIPERGSIVIFVKKGMVDFDGGGEKQLIKRVIGLPGERVQIKNGVMTVYNNENPNGFNPDETLNLKSNILGPTEDIVDETIPEKHIFVVGDHRNNSLDSRTFGSIPSDDIVGTLTARILPLSSAQKF